MYSQAWRLDANRRSAVDGACGGTAGEHCGGNGQQALDGPREDRGGISVCGVVIAGPHVYRIVGQPRGLFEKYCGHTHQLRVCADALHLWIKLNEAAGRTAVFHPQELPAAP
jgi:hypothetical protein